MPSTVPPADLVTVGHVADAWGIRGEIKAQPYSPDADALLEVKDWWLEIGGALRAFEVSHSKMHGNAVTARLTGIDDRNAAEQLKGARIAVARSAFPPLGKDEFYWVDLIGLDVVNVKDEPLGKVSGLLDNPAHPLLEVRQERDGATVERLIPFVEVYVKTVDRDAGRIVVDWAADWDA